MKLERRDEPAENTQPADTDKPEKAFAKRKLAAMIYMLVLFAVALGLVVLSYFLQQRRSEETITNLTEQHSEITIQALQNIEELQQGNIDLTKRLGETEEKLHDAEDALADAKKELSEANDKLSDAEKRSEEQAKELSDAQMRLEASRKLLEAILAQDEETHDAALAAIEPLKEYLDGDSRIIYEELLEEKRGNEQ